MPGKPVQKQHLLDYTFKRLSTASYLLGVFVNPLIKTECLINAKLLLKGYADLLKVFVVLKGVFVKVTKLV